MDFHHFLLSTDAIISVTVDFSYLLALITSNNLLNKGDNPITKYTKCNCNRHDYKKELMQYIYTHTHIQGFIIDFVQ